MTSIQKGMRSAAVVLIMSTLGGLACGADVTSRTPTESSPPNPPAGATYTIQLSPASISLMAPPGEPRSVVVTATVRTSKGDVVPQPAVVWTTDSPGVATVTETGMVTAVGEGSTVLHARFGGVEANGVITVAASNNFVATGSMSTPREGHTATLLPDGKVLIAGGTDGSQATASAELYDPASGAFARTGGMTRARAGHSATLLPNGKVLIAGGFVGNELTATAELYDPATGTFSRTGDMQQAQRWHAATLLMTGKILISGGSGGWSGGWPIAANPELYDPATGEFTVTGTYASLDPERNTQGLIAINATLLRDGHVLLSAEPAAQIYDPVGGTFSRTGTMVTGSGWTLPYIEGRTATLLDDGRVLLTGGEQEDVGRFNTAELYDPATGGFAATGTMAFVRDGHTATLLANGTVLITGGESEAGCAIRSIASAELYNPSGGSFASAGAMTVRRERHTATRLNDGRVLLTGGFTFDGGLCGNGFAVVPLASAELYVPRN